MAPPHIPTISRGGPAHGKAGPRTGPAFPAAREYARCVQALDRAGVLTLLPGSGQPGVTGPDGTEYPVPTLPQAEALFVRDRALVRRKALQGFDRLVLTPMAMPLSVLAERLEAAILRHAEQGMIFRTRRSPSDPLIPVRVNPALTVWVWETLREAFGRDGLVYFPREYPADHGGMTKSGAIRDKRICAFPGWSVGLVESMPVMPTVGQAKNPGGRWQLPIGLSPREYLAKLKEPEYAGETGFTLEDFITEFLVRLETTHEVSRDVSDDNALWCLGQYKRLPYAQAVPTGRWHRPVGRVRLDMHRTGNKLCARSFGAATVVRLPGA